MINIIKEDSFSKFRANTQAGQPRLQSTFVGSFFGILRLSPDMAQSIQPVMFALLGVSTSHASRPTSRAASWGPLVQTEPAFPMWNNYKTLIPRFGISYSDSNNSEGILNLVSVSSIFHFSLPEHDRCSNHLLYCEGWGSPETMIEQLASGHWSRDIWVQILLLINCVMMGKLFILSEPQFIHP